MYAIGNEELSLSLSRARENLQNSLDKYETISGSVRHGRTLEGEQTRSTKSDTKFDRGIF